MKDENGEQRQNVITVLKQCKQWYVLNSNNNNNTSKQSFYSVLRFPFKEHIVETEKDQRQAGQSHGKYSYLRETEETVIVCFVEEIRRDKIKADKPITQREKDEKH